MAPILSGFSIVADLLDYPVLIIQKIRTGGTLFYGLCAVLKLKLSIFGGFHYRDAILVKKDSFHQA